MSYEGAGLPLPLMPHRLSGEGQRAVAADAQRIAQYTGALEYSQLYMGWHFVPCPAVENATGFLFLNSAPLLKEKRHAGANTLVTNLSYPLRANPPCPWS
jgi:hypothetical protein